MHEVGIAAEILQIVQTAAHEAGMTSVTRIKVVLGNQRMVVQDLCEEIRPPAMIRSIRKEKLPLSGSKSFEIQTSKQEGQSFFATPADMVVCQQCMEDMKNPPAAFIPTLLPAAPIAARVTPSSTPCLTIAVKLPCLDSPYANVAKKNSKIRAIAGFTPKRSLVPTVGRKWFT